ncbi:MAG: deoxynucleoside kinase [Mycoplasmataceae bacterium]|nr:deoxynucleoside kinase [Mycoplasmataceae bacterium]
MQKVSNSIVIGGMVASGKSSLVGALPLIPVQELNSNDELQNVLLKRMYEGNNIAGQVFQLDMMLLRSDKYKKMANLETPHAFDRMIFEDKLFAYLNFSHIENVYEYYSSIWEDKVDEIINEIGIPKIYILLSINWDTFKERIMKRGRSAEMDSFAKNEDYFRKLLKLYDSFVTGLLSKYKIPFIVIDTNELDRKEVYHLTMKILKEREII